MEGKLMVRQQTVYYAYPPSASPVGSPLGTTYTIWKNQTLSLAFYTGETAASKEVYVSWNPDKTKIVSARLRVVANANNLTGLKFSVNQQEVIRFYWELFENWWEKIAEEDVTSILLNGSNLFEVTFWKDNPLGVSTIFNATLIVEFEGTSPSVREKTWFEENWYYVVGGIAAIVIGGVIIAKVKRK
jgi:hypothetical protein